MNDIILINISIFMRKSLGRFQQCSQQEADGVCWAFNNQQDEPRLYYFKLPSLEDDEVLINIVYSSICYTDYKWVKKMSPPLPIAPGHQYVGKIIAVGNKVTNRKIGDIVGVGYKRANCHKCRACQKGIQQACTGHPLSMSLLPQVGGFSTHAICTQQWAHIVPQNMPLQWVPPLMCAGITLYNPLTRLCQKGDKVAIIGIGGLGHLGILIGSKMQLEITAFSTNANKEQEVKNMGATNFVVINPENIRNYKQKFDVVILAGNIPSEQFEGFCRLSKKGGKVANVHGMAPNNPKIDFSTIVLDQRELCGVITGTKQQFKDMLQFCTINKIAPISEKVNFMDFPQAFKKTGRSEARYRMLLEVPENILKKQ